MIGSNADVIERLSCAGDAVIAADILLCAFHLVDCPDEVLLRLRAVAGHAAPRLAVLLYRLVTVEGLIFPFAVGDLGGKSGPRAGALSHGHSAKQLSGSVIDQGDDSATCFHRRYCASVTCFIQSTALPSSFS
jgi:hypothetical protein